MLKTFGWLLFSLIMLNLTSPSASAEEKQPHRQMQFVGGPGDIWMLSEVGMVAILKDGKLTIEGIAPAKSRPKGYESIDLQQGDVIVMANGKKISATKDLSSMYDSLAVGQDLKLGIRRGDQMLMATVKKADPATLPKRRMVVSEGGTEGGAALESKVQQSIDIDGDATEITPIPGAGIILGLKGKNIVVAGIMPHAKETLGDAAIAKGDIVTALQDKSVNSVQEFEKGFEQIKVGDPVTISLTHEGKALKASFTKTESQFRTIIKKN